MTGTIPFKNIPANLRLPLFYAETDNSQANTGQSTQRTLIIGQITAAGSAVVNVPVQSQSLTDASSVGGPGSLLHLMNAVYRQNDNFGEVWYLPLADDPAATAATGTITVTSAATAAGTIALYIAGVKVAQPVSGVQTSAQIATAMAASINATPNLPVTAAAAASVVTLTAINKGPSGNEIDLRLNYLGRPGGEVMPTGLVLTIVQMANGATAPNLTTALGNLSNLAFDFIVCAYTDTTSLNAMANLLNDSTGRWSWSNQLYGHAFAAVRGTVGAVTTFGTARNDPHTTVIGFNDSPSPAWLWAAAITGTIAPSVRADPATPLQTLAVRGVLAPPLQSRYINTDRNVLLWSGVTTFTVGDDGTVYLENVITTYQKNALGNPDNSYLEIETLYTLAFVLRSMRNVITSKYARVKLAQNGTHFAAGSNVVTPNVIRGDLIAQYRTLEEQGLVQGGDAFKQNLVVQINASNPNRVDVLWPATVIGQLRIFALLAQFRLQ